MRKKTDSNYKSCNYCSCLFPSPTQVLTIKVSKRAILLAEWNLFRSSLIKIYHIVRKYVDDTGSSETSANLYQNI